MKSISFYTYSTYFSGGYKSKRFSFVLTNTNVKSGVVNLIGLPEGPNDYFSSVNHIQFKLHKFLNKIPNNIFLGKKRFLLEKSFDIFGVFCLFFDGSEIIFTSIRLNFIAFFAKKLGKIIVFEASEMHPFYTLKILENEYKRLNIYEKNLYTNKLSINSFLNSIKYSDLIICFTKYSFNSYTEHLINKKNLTLINPGIDSNNVKSYNDNNSIVFICTANHTLLKGTHKLLHAWSNLRPQSKLLIIGQLSYKISEYIISNKLCLDNVEFLGSKNFDEIDKIYNDNNGVGILLSFSEAGPRSVLEYLSHGFPTIVTEPCSFDMIKNNVNGYVLDVNCSIMQIEIAINNYICNKNIYEKFFDFNSINNFTLSKTYSDNLSIVLNEL
jgi:hypothetical protein